MAKYSYHRLDANHREIVTGLRRAGCSVDFRSPGDALVGRAGVNYVLEIKTARGKQRATQKAFQAGWRGQYALVRSLEDALAVVGAK